MPIKPENAGRYPANWKEIRARILDRAGNRCEWCRLRNGVWIVRHPQTGGVVWQGPTREASQELTATWDIWVSGAGGQKTVRVVLTIAHIHDPSPENCADENLAALCQRCHNRHDAEMRKANAAETRRRKLAQHQPALLEAACDEPSTA